LWISWLDDTYRCGVQIDAYEVVVVDVGIRDEKELALVEHGFPWKHYLELEEACS
jgi:hypothetical protein